MMTLQMMTSPAQLNSGWTVKPETSHTGACFHREAKLNNLEAELFV